MEGWTASYRRLTPSLVNIIPDDDIIEHDRSPKCGCQPEVEVVRDGPHTRGRVIHHQRVA